MKMDYSMPLSEATELYSTAQEDALASLATDGLDMPPRPMLSTGGYYDGHLPSDLNSFTNNQLGEIFTLQCQFADWVGSLATVEKANLMNAGEKLKVAQAAIRKSKSGTVQAREDATVTDSRYIHAKREVLYVETRASLLEYRAEVARRDLKVISRLITVKGQEIDMNRRDLNIGRKKHGRRDRDVFSS